MFIRRPVAGGKLVVGETIKFTIAEPFAVDALCGSVHSYSINARMSLICEGGTAKPTTDPTVMPSQAPTLPKPSMAPTTPTTNPTPAPTEYAICGYNRFCYEISVNTSQF